MAVKTVNERFQGRRSEWRNGKLVHLQEWLVTCDDKADGPAVAIAADDNKGNKIPGPNDAPDYDPTASLTALIATPHHENERKFVVQAEFTSTSFGVSITDPLQRPPEISYAGTDATEPYFIDRSDTPKRVVNSAGDPFSRFLDRETGEISFTITVNEATFNTVTMDSFKHTVNAAPVTVDGVTYDTGTLKLGVPTAVKTTERVQSDVGDVFEIVTFYRVTYPVKARADGWDDSEVDEGLNELIPNADPSKPAKLKPILDSGTSLQTDQPQLLDGAGRKKQPGPGGTITPTTVTFKPYRSTDFLGEVKPYHALDLGTGQHMSVKFTEAGAEKIASSDAEGARHARSSRL